MISAASHAIPPRPSLLAAVFKIFLNDFVFWSMCRLSPNGLLAALGVPLDVQQELSRGDNERARAFLSSILPMSARKTGQLIEQHMSEYEASQIEGIQAPTLVVHARDDTLVAFEHAEFAAQNIPGAQLISLEKGGHLAFMFDFNQDARRRVLEFLDRYKS
jgi:pimeloyl-ACP methyl ester carboxylesterase